MNAAVADMAFADEKPPAQYHRDPALKIAEARLEAWSAWAKQNRSSLGLPTISVLYTAMMRSKLGVIFEAIAETSKHTALGRETRSFHVRETEIAEPIAETDAAVARLPQPLHRVLVANYFTYGPVEVRAKASGYKLARFKQLLESAKWAVWSSIEHAAIEI